MKKQKIQKLERECLKTWVGIFQVGILQISEVCSLKSFHLVEQW